MTEEIIHPGFRPEVFQDDSIPPLSGEELEQRLFSDYEPFFDFRGLFHEEQSQVKSFLRILFDNTREFWESRMCREFIRKFNQTRNEIESKLELNDVKEIRARKNIKTPHFWLELVLTNNRVFIIDPVGGPLTAANKKHYQTHLPYFGLVNNLIDFMKEIYDYGQEITINDVSDTREPIY